ncbi:MAG TPA: excinuclease ABC subunit UvrA [Alphaproteobacteria bacterium]|nr:excinuclease ABC subunit UvrA [Alphaproteobacteria bacterium]
MNGTASKIIAIKGAREHNLKDIDVTIPRDKLVVITGLSGSGKSSLAFDTIYAEGQRRYVESLSAYARQFLEQMDKPDVDSIEGLSPAISIEQKTTSKNPRSTVGTVTEIYDYLRLLFARVGTPHCYRCGRVIASQTVQQIVDQIVQLPEGARLQILAPLARGRKGEYRKELEELRRQGYTRVRVDGQVRELSERIELDKMKHHTIEAVIDRVVIKSGIEKRLADSIETAMHLAEGIVAIHIADGEDLVFSEKFACIDCGISYAELSPRLFSFNSPHGACPDCDGLGFKQHLDLDFIIPDPAKSLRAGAIKPWDGQPPAYLQAMLEALAEHYNFDLDTPYKKLSAKVQDIILYGSRGEKIRFFYDKGGKRHYYLQEFEGVVPYVERKYLGGAEGNDGAEVEDYISVKPCARCQGARLRPEGLAVKIAEKSIAEVTALSVKEALRFFDALHLTPQQLFIAERVLKEIRERLQFLVNVGLDYLTLDRPAATLSGGEGQRIRLATQIGSSLVGVLYILDEPSIGLHPRDNRRLLDTLERLRDMGNTVIVVEHDRDTILAGDYVIDLGPGAGVHGGYIVAQGTPQELCHDEASVTGRYLSGRLDIPVPTARRRGNGKCLTLVGASENNLRNITVQIPLGVLTCITGVSGSGKSTLLIDVLYRALAQKLYRSPHKPGRHQELLGVEHIDKVIDIDQSPIGRTPRSNPATYTGVFTDIRSLFAQVPEGRMRGYKPGRFSFNVKGGRCEACQGNGVIKIEMHFLPDIFVNCDVCKGKRFNRETLEIKYKGKSIAEVLDMTVDEALAFFTNVPALKDKLETLSEVGLGYIALGQAATTLSGGEAQRVKLAKELSRRSTGRTVYILDEPTTGLHFADIQQLLHVLNRLVDLGNTVLVIEHNLDVMKTADYIIDLGPEGGDAGGEVVACGTPEEVAQAARSHTGRFLATVLGSGRSQDVAIAR